MAEQRIKILQFSISSTMGGRTQYILNMWNKINHNKFLFDFITFSKREDFEQKLKVSPGTVYYMKNYPENNRDGFINEFMKVLENGYDVIEIHTSYWKDTIIEEMAIKAGIPKIIIHGHSTGITQITADNKDKEKLLIEKHFEVKNQLNVSIATDYWACSEKCAEWIFYPSIPENKVKIIHNTIDTKRFAYSAELRDEARRKLNLVGCFVFGFVGRLEPAKNLEFLLDVFDKCQGDHENIRLLIVGDGSMRGILERKVEEKDISDKVIFVGQKSNTEYYYQLMDCFLLPSVFEGFPISAIEAQCSGLKCILSDNITREVAVIDNVSFLPISDIELWYSELSKASKGYKRIDASSYMFERGFDTDNYIARLEKFYCMRTKK